MGTIILSTESKYMEYMNSVRDRVGADIFQLPNSKIDSFSFLHSVEDDFIFAVGEDFYENSSPLLKKKIIRYLLLKTTVEIIQQPEYMPIIKEQEFGEGVTYDSISLSDKLETLINQIKECALAISDKLLETSEVRGRFEIFKIAGSY